MPSHHAGRNSAAPTRRESARVMVTTSVADGRAQLNVFFDRGDRWTRDEAHYQPHADGLCHAFTAGVGVLT